MKPTTSQIDAYCALWQPVETAPENELLIVHNAFGKGLEGFGVADRRGDDWFGYAGKVMTPTHWMPLPKSPEKTAPPKLREFTVAVDKLGDVVMATRGGCGGGGTESIRVREVSETADAEIAEKLRNHDALCRAIKDYREYRGAIPDLARHLDKHGAKLP